LNNERPALPINRVLNKENGRRLVMGGVMLLVIGLIFLVGYPHLTSYRVIGIIGAVELFIGLVMYQTYDTAKSSETPKLQ
jgi:NADH:ubiquinone oxidoreductase subunit 6 (subunit J)